MGSRSQLAAVRSTSNREKRSTEPATAVDHSSNERGEKGQGTWDRDDSGSGIPGTEFLQPTPRRPNALLRPVSLCLAWSLFLSSRFT